MKTEKKPRLLVSFLKKLACSILFKVEFKNQEILDKYSSYIIAPNHTTVFDIAFVFPIQYDKDISIAAKKELFKNPLFRALAKNFNVFSVDREVADVSALLKSRESLALSDTSKLIIFPEGRIMKDKSQLGKVYKKGTSFLAYHLQKPIIPVFISHRPKFFSKVKVIYGEPIFIDKIIVKGRKKFDEASQYIVSTIYSLNDEE